MQVRCISEIDSEHDNNVLNRTLTSTMAALEGIKRLFLTAFTPTDAIILLISQIKVE